MYDKEISCKNSKNLKKWLILCNSGHKYIENSWELLFLDENACWGPNTCDNG